MKNKIKTVMACAIITVLLISNGCKKDKYQPKGNYGNANVSSASVTTTTGWGWDATNFWSYKTLNWSDITSDVIDKGVINVYMSTSYGWAQWPRTIVLNGGVTQSQRFYSNVGNIQLIIANSDYTNANPGSLSFKVVIVTPLAKMAHPNVNYANYEEVKRTFNLKD